MIRGFWMGGKVRCHMVRVDLAHLWGQPPSAVVPGEARLFCGGQEPVELRSTGQPRAAVPTDARDTERRLEGELDQPSDTLLPGLIDFVRRTAMNPLIHSGRQLSVALLLLRIASASAFLYHGSAILFGAFGGLGPGPFAASHHCPIAVAYLIGLAQVGGAFAMLTGILFRVGAASVCIVMLGAILLFH